VFHRNARLTVHGRLLIVQRHQAGWKQAHIAAAMGVSRKCVKTWIDRYAAEGEAGLETRSSRPHTMPTRVGAEVEQRVLALRAEHRCGQDVLGPLLGVPPRTVARILRRHGAAYLRACDPMTGQVIRSSKTTAVRYERDRPGELVHMDVKKLGKIPDGGGWRAHGRAATVDHRHKKVKVGYDYVHSLVDDHSRLAYSEILPDETGATCAAFLGARRGVLRRPGDHPDRTRHDRQRPGLPALGRPQAGGRRARSPAEVHQAPLSVAEREGRAPQPHAGHRMGLPADLRQQRGPSGRPCALDRALQHCPPPQRTQGQTPNQPPVTNVVTGYT